MAITSICPDFGIKNAPVSRSPTSSGSNEMVLKFMAKVHLPLSAYRKNLDYPEFFEGGGDACFTDYNTLWAGFGPRTNKEVVLFWFFKIFFRSIIV